MEKLTKQAVKLQLGDEDELIAHRGLLNLAAGSFRPGAALRPAAAARIYSSLTRVDITNGRSASATHKRHATGQNHIGIGEEWLGQLGVWTLQPP
jgi:hypothetical protein